ncbi:MAG TPA: gas vesicle protein GvpH [Pirellulales bacterium]|nr:gas vesicle protein GvpH [Pirellulales bacterium]
MTRKHATKRRMERKPQGEGGFLGGLVNLIEKLGELAEKGEELKRTGEIRGIEPTGRVRGVYGVTIRTGLGGERDAVKVEPFGNVRADEKTGKPVVHEVREPMVDVFEEDDEILIVAEMPGVGAQDVHLEMHEDILVISASSRDKKYRKEVLLPEAAVGRSMTSKCRNGVLEVRFAGTKHKANEDA